LGFATATATGAAEPEPAGFVLSLSGKWQLTDAGQRTLSPGDSLPAGAKIRPERADAPGFIEIARFDGKAERHEAEFTLAERVESSVSNRMLTAVMGRYRGRVVVTAGRGGGLLADGLVLLDDGKIDLTPLLSELPPGKWQLQISRRRNSASNEEAAAAVKVSIDWDGENAAPVEAGPLGPGLYEVQLVNARTGRTLGDAALILVCTPATFAAKRRDFAEALKLTASWEEADCTAGAEAFRRVYLETLAE
jgi:hypothetical protein